MKIAYVMLEDGESEDTIKKHFMDKHKASEELALKVAKKEMDILNRIDYKNGYSLYIGIPFCPSICLYCSFSSYALGAYKDYVDSYLDALIKEMEFVSESMKGRRLDNCFKEDTVKKVVGSEYNKMSARLKNLLKIPSNLYIWQHLDKESSYDGCLTTSHLIDKWFEQICMKSRLYAIAIHF